MKKLLSLILVLLVVSCGKENESIDSSKNVKISNLSFIGSNFNKQNPLKGVLFNGLTIYEIAKKNKNVDALSFENFVKDKIFELENYTKNITAKKDKPSLEEIRNAMIEECENGYCCGLDEACKLAVKIAYHIKKHQEDVNYLIN